MAFESFQSEKIQKPKKIGFVLAIAKYGSYLKNFLAMPKVRALFSLSSSTIAMS